MLYLLGFKNYTFDIYRERGREKEYLFYEISNWNLGEQYEDKPDACNLIHRLIISK
jgi:hypothetical protein